MLAASRAPPGCPLERPSRPAVSLFEIRSSSRACRSHARSPTHPSRSSWTNKLITAKDHRSVQINIGHLDESGLYPGSFSAFALTGQVRVKGDADSALDILWTKKRAELGQ